MSITERFEFQKENLYTKKRTIGMEKYMLGFSTGMLLGLTIALPGQNDVTTHLTKEEVNDLRRGHLTEDFRKSLCNRYEEKLSQTAEIPKEEIALCAYSNQAKHVGSFRR
jgi:hypothetical protein